MKKLIAMIMAALLACTLLAACAPTAADGPDVTIQPSTAPEETPAVPEESPASPTDQPEETPAAVTQEQMDAMLPILDSLTRALNTGEDTAYDAADAETVWYTLYLMGNNYGGLDELTTQNEDHSLSIPTALVEEYMAAAFNGATELPELPEEDKNVTYDAENEVYVFAPSDIGDSNVSIDSFIDNGNGTVTAATKLTDSEDTLYAAYIFTLAPNPAAEDGSSAFPFLVTAAVKS